MADTFEIQVHTVYSSATQAAKSARLRWVAFLTILVSLAWMYVLWWQVFSWLERPMSMGQAIIFMGVAAPGASGESNDIAAFSTLLRGESARPGKNADASDATPNNKGDSGPTRGRAAQAIPLSSKVLAAAGVCWLGVPTLVGLWLMAAGVAGLIGPSALRFLGYLIAPMALAAGGYLYWYAQKEYGWYESILPDWVTPAMLGLAMAFAGSVGAMFARRGLRLLRLGGVLVIASAVLSVVALWAAVKWGQMPAEGISPMLYAKIFAGQSAYGWILLLSLIRIRR